MTHEKLKNGLKQLGFDSGWAITGNEITLWENAEPQPSNEEILIASALYEQTLETIAAEKAAAKSALLERLGITAEEAALLLG